MMENRERYNVEITNPNGGSSAAFAAVISNKQQQQEQRRSGGGSSCRTTTFARWIVVGVVVLWIPMSLYYSLSLYQHDDIFAVAQAGVPTPPTTTESAKTIRESDKPIAEFVPRRRRKSDGSGQRQRPQQKEQQNQARVQRQAEKNAAFTRAGSRSSTISSNSNQPRLFRDRNNPSAARKAIEEALSEAAANTTTQKQQTYDVIRLYGLDYLYHAAHFFTPVKFCDKQLKRRQSRRLNASSSDQHLHHEHPEEKQLIFTTADCDKIPYLKSGAGNYLLMIYTLRLASRALGFIDLAMLCKSSSNNNHTQQRQRQQEQPSIPSHKFVLPWVMGWFPLSSSTSLFPPTNTTQKQEGGNTNKKDEEDFFPSASQVCRRNATPPLNFMIPEIQYDLRRMAIAHLAIPGPWHPSYQWARDFLNFTSTNRNNPRGNTSQHHHDNSIRQAEIPAIPYYSKETIDDAVIHFRCGDILQRGHVKYGFLKYEAYAKRISPTVTSIGIVTLPFPPSTEVAKENAQKKEPENTKAGTTTSRGVDMKAVSVVRCRALVLPFQAYLQERFPHATVTIRNSKMETPSLSLSRMIMANQTFSAMSTFSLFGTLATFGTGYLYRPPENSNSLNGFLTQDPPLEERHPNLKFMDEHDSLDSQSMVKLWDYASFLAFKDKKNKKRIKKDTATKRILEWFHNESLRFPKSSERQHLLSILEQGEA